MSRNAIPFLMPLLLCVGSYSAQTFPSAIFNFALKMYSGSIRLDMEASICSFLRFTFPLNMIIFADYSKLLMTFNIVS